jgi:mRNA degradation ribonuclease J1/J2
LKILEVNKGASPVKVIPIGGLNEIGKNMTLLEHKNDIMIIDCGLSFPEDEMFGIDIVIPDFRGDYFTWNYQRFYNSLVEKLGNKSFGA